MQGGRGLALSQGINIPSRHPLHPLPALCGSLPELPPTGSQGPRYFLAVFPGQEGLAGLSESAGGQETPSLYKDLSTVSTFFFFSIYYSCIEGKLRVTLYNQVYYFIYVNKINIKPYSRIHEEVLSSA